MSRINEFIKIPGSKEILYILEQYAGRPLHSEKGGLCLLPDDAGDIGLDDF